jgi:hypothetical protein
MAEKKSTKPGALLAAKAAEAKRSLGLSASAHLPRCGHWSKFKAEALAKAGDPSHLAPNHSCPLCTCQYIAGSRTSSKTKIGEHYGVGWCALHEKNHSKEECQRRADQMTDLIRKGVPNRQFLYRTASDNLQKLYKEADESKGIIDMRDNQILVIDLVQRLLNYIENNAEGKSDGFGFTESYKDGPGPAADMTVLDMLNKLLNTQGKLSKVQLEITESQYCHMDEVKVFFGQVMREAENIFPQELLQIFVQKVMAIEQPRPGKRGRK